MSKEATQRRQTLKNDRGSVPKKTARSKNNKGGKAGMKASDVEGEGEGGEDEEDDKQQSGIHSVSHTHTLKQSNTHTHTHTFIHMQVLQQEPSCRFRAKSGRWIVLFQKNLILPRVFLNAV